VVQHTVEENVARLSRERAAAMDMSAPMAAQRGGGGALGGASLTVRDVAALLCSSWRDAGP
jgi:hypothetical protein